MQTPVVSFVSQENELTLGLTESLSVKCYSSGTAMTPDSATYVLYDSGSTVLASGSATIATNTVSVSVASTLFTAVEENCRLKLDVIKSSVTYRQFLIFDVVNSKLYNSVTDDDLKKSFPDITSQLWSTQTTYDTQIREAFDRVRNDIKAIGRRPTLIVDASQISPLIIAKALELIFFAFIRSPEDVYEMRYREMCEKYDRLLKVTPFRYDESGDGIIDTTTRNVGYVRLKR